MKKKLFAILFTVLVLVCVSCNKQTFSDQWSYDETYHYHASTSGSDAVADKAAHTFDKAFCTVCGYNRLIGKWDVDYQSAKTRVIELFEIQLEASMDEFAAEYGIPLENVADSEQFKEYRAQVLAQADDYTKMIIEYVNFAIDILDNENCVVFGNQFNGAEGSYAVSDDNELVVTIGEYVLGMGVFNDDFTLLNIEASEDSNFPISLSKTK